MVYISEGEGEPVNEAGKEQPLKAGDFTPLNPDAKHHYQKKGDKPFTMICEVPKD